MTKTYSLTQHAQKIRKLLREIFSPHVVIPKKFTEDVPFIFDFTKENKRLINIDPHNTDAFSQYISETLNRVGRILGVGQFAEDRTIYQSPLYKTNGEVRSVHLGIDLFVPTGTSIFAPLDATVHSFQDNDNFLDYGPTIILEHNLAGVKFYTLYGHLDRASLKKVTVGQKIKAGERIARVGQQHENGNWPSHLHFQIITDLLGYKGDFPGVVKPSEKKYYLQLCPDPNLLLRIPWK